jgi:hypothetical protein
MTNHTASLLMLFVAGLLAAALLLAAATSVSLSRSLGPWLPPAIAVVCEVAIFFLGRRFILPDAIARSAGRALMTIVAILVVSLMAAGTAIWVLRWASGGVLTAPGLTLLLWFVLLWAALRQQNWHSSLKNGWR